MYYLLTLFTGILISAMVAVNGGLTEQYGLYSATVIIHIVGLLLITVILIAKREHPFAQRNRWFLYLGGVSGVGTTLFNNLAFGRISVSAIMALGLFGQCISGLIIDQYGLLNMPKHPFHKRKTIGLIIVFIGIVSMIDHFILIPVLLSFATGITVVLSRTLNAGLADASNVNISTFFNYLTGFVVSLLLYFILGGGEVSFAAITLSPYFYVYFGGVIGVCVVFLSNITVVKVSAFYLSLFLFIGQVLSSILIDAAITRTFSSQNLIGGLLVAAGLSVNLFLDYKKPLKSITP